ncbi:MAG: FadD3 family acyl-CoA ligase [Acidimicrobiia bacterium]|nr:FadD3 family acyl-CoA ligase [Acidimicrobiia bacterium]
MVRSAAERYGGAEAVADGDTRLSFTDVLEASREATRAMIAAGLAPGERVGIWAPNVHEWIVCALGILSAGGVVVPVNTRYRGQEAAYILNKSRARMLFTVTGFLDTDYVALLRGSGEDVPSLERIVVLRGDAAEGSTSWADLLAAGTAVSPEEAEERARAVEPGDTCDILYTSGTTGHPKGVVCHHEQALRTYHSWTGIIGIAEGDRYLIVNPFFHNFGYRAGWLCSMMRGACSVPMATLDMDELLGKVEEERISVLAGPPTLFLGILNHPNRSDHDLSSLRLGVTGAAAVPVEMIKRMRNELTFKTVISGYGLTEATGLATMSYPDDDPEIIATTSGRAIPGTEIRIVDDSNQEVPRGEPGELVVRGYNVMTGYFEDPEGTAAAIDHDGWLHTGDIAVMDEQGNVRITDRLKDMFIVGGFNAYPAEIENALLTHPAIAQAAVVGIPDGRLGEVGIAFVITRPGQTVDPGEVIAWCRERMANFKVPRRIEVVDSFPLNATGKVLRYELRERARIEGPDCSS